MSSDRDQLIAVNVPLRNLEVHDLDQLVDVNSVSLGNLGDLEKTSPSFISQITTKRADRLSA